MNLYPEKKSIEGLVRHEDAESEGLLWDEFRRGSVAALEKIFDTYIALLYKFGYRISVEKAIVEDCIQELFIELWEKKEFLSETTSIKYYLFKALRRKIIRKLERERKYIEHNELKAEYEFLIDFSHEANLINSQTSEEEKKKLSQALQKLSSKQKEIIYLKYYDNFSFEEIGQMMGLSKKAAYNLVFKAIQALRNYIPGIGFLAMLCYLSVMFWAVVLL